ncbi:hypothetical protein F2Q69_00046404 [Brassica cretica]|uniref:Serine/threonine-protein kinase 11-interacting protein n=1 Tax=Brassica cretica TaxID=69181 RepID=A0A8S9PU37_BRACR|nr:hypothetical protein F2Q69_00046404 [Brassica cretica]
MAIVTGDRYVEKLQKFLEEETESLLEETMVLKLNPAGLHYIHLRLESLRELERMLSGAPVDYLRAYVSDLGDYRALEQLRRILRILTSVKVVSTLPSPARDPTPLSLIPFGRLKVLELRGCDLSTSPAKGLLDLRHTLEKIICHNSTDALRHVFASRIAEITNSQEWNKLAVVSCSCNRLVLMDESLQLLSAAESLDLSRNKFAKVDNLRRCTKLKHLDLGFNHLRTVSHLSQVSCHLVKLVLRNNALTTLRGIENLKSLEGLDVSYNIISNFSELELLWSLSLLKELWLEGNPVCCARWYRAHVFSYIAIPDGLKLDGKQIGTREFWKRQIIVAHRHSEPASYGFYYPAREEGNEEESCNRKKASSHKSTHTMHILLFCFNLQQKMICRLASIDCEEESTYANSDQETVSCDHENKDNLKCDQDADIFGLIRKVENLKKERSVLWLREFKEWMDHSSEDFADVSKDSLGINMEKYCSNARGISRQHSGTRRYSSSSLRASRDKGHRKNLECNGSSGDHKTGMDDMKFVEGNETQTMTSDISSLGLQATNQSQEFASVEPNNLFSTAPSGEKLAENGNASTLDIGQDIMGSFSSTYPGSPPHYQKDVLHRRQNLVEEILQLSADSYSVASSDSTSSCSEDDNYDSESEYSNHENSRLTDLLNVNRLREEIPGCEPKVTSSLDSQPENGSSIIESLRTGGSMKENTSSSLSELHNGEHICHLVETKKSIRKPIKRYVSFQKEESCITNAEASLSSDADICFSGSDHLQESSLSMMCSSSNSNSRYLRTDRTHEGKGDSVEEYFSAKLADSSSQETCRTYMSCDFILQKGSTYKQREAVLLLSTLNKLYVLLVGVSATYQGSTLSVLCSHEISELQDVSVGLGLQLVRLRFFEDAEYIFVTKCIEKTTELLNIIQVFDSQDSKCSLGSLENIQVDLFEKEICGGLKLSIFQYNILQFQSSTLGEALWRWRSLFVAGGRLFICNEDLAQLSSQRAYSSSAPYFSLDSCCSISDISETIVQSQGRVVSLKIKETRRVDSVIWKLKWCCTEKALKFVTLVKALHPDSAQCPLAVS